MKTLSKMYCYNYKFIEFAFDCVRKGDYKETSGYIPLYGHIRKEIIEKELPEKKHSVEIDSYKLFYLEQLVKEAGEKGTQVVLVISPSWKGGNLEVEAYSCIRFLVEKYGVRLFEYINSDICEDPDNFEDSSHLNDKGAKEFTEGLVSRIL